MLKSAAIAGAVLSVLASTAASAAVIQWTAGAGANGHFYEYVAGHLSWTDARAAALLRVNAGEGGYLATVTSEAENVFLSTVVWAGGAWLGGSDSGVEGTWTWADGPEAGDVFWQNGPVVGAFTYWGSSEPNNFNNSNEDFLTTNSGAATLWNDLPAGTHATVGGYFVEYHGELPTTGTIPEPATWAMMILGFGLAGSALRSTRDIVGRPA